MKDEGAARQAGDKNFTFGIFSNSLTLRVGIAALHCVLTTAYLLLPTAYSLELTTRMAF